MVSTLYQFNVRQVLGFYAYASRSKARDSNNSEKVFRGEEGLAYSLRLFRHRLSTLNRPRLRVTDN